MELPEPRSDGICVECLGKPAVTNCGRWCLKCLRKRIRDDNPIPKPMRDDLGRSVRSTQVIGGSAEMRSDDD